MERRSPDFEKEEDVTLLDRCEAKRKHGKNIGSVTKVCSLWRTSLGSINEELKKLEEALLRPEEGKLEKVSRLYKAKTGVGWLPPESSPGLDKRNKGRNRGVAGKACTTMFFLIPKLEALRATEVAKWQQKYRVDWDATDGRNGGAQRTLREVLMEMERFKHRAGEEDQGWAWATHFSFPR